MAGVAFVGDWLSSALIIWAAAGAGMAAAAGSPTLDSPISGGATLDASVSSPISGSFCIAVTAVVGAGTDTGLPSCVLAEVANVDLSARTAAC